MQPMTVAGAKIWSEEIERGRLRETLRLNYPNLLSALMLDNEAERGQWKPELAARGYIPHGADVLRALWVFEREQWWQWYGSVGPVNNAVLGPRSQLCCVRAACATGSDWVSGLTAITVTCDPLAPHQLCIQVVEKGPGVQS